MDILSDHYLLLEPIANGSFGEVYLAKNEKGKKIAIKVEKKVKNDKLWNEYKIYHILHKMKFGSGLPVIYEYIQLTDNNIMVMELLGNSLDNIFNNSGKKFSLRTTINIGRDILRLLRKLHSFGYIHRDIKPANFLIGLDDKTMIYIMDFGLSGKYINNKNHIPFKTDCSFRGTVRYASVNTHMGFEQSRRDDLESLGYMLVYFVKGYLPWQSGKLVKKNIVEKATQNKYDHVSTIEEIKLSVSAKELCEGLPICFCKFIEYCKNLSFDILPDYSYLEDLFIDELNLLGRGYKFQWEKKYVSNNYI